MAAARGAASLCSGVEVRVLGPIEVRPAGEPVDLGTPRQPALVALALSRGWPVSVDAIVELLWEDAAPRTAAYAGRTSGRVRATSLDPSSSRF